MSLRFHEIAETNHRILNPITEAQLLRLGELCHASSSTRLLDLACGKGEMLCQWALHYGVIGVGVDISPVFIAAARARGFDLAVWDKVSWVEAAAAEYPAEHHQFDIVSCLGATWIGGGLLGTLALMRVALNKAGGTLLIGEPYWLETPPAEAYTALEIQPDTFTTLEGTQARLKSAGAEIKDILLATPEGWDAYVNERAQAVAHWLETRAADADAAALRDWDERERRAYQQYERPYLGWGVFVATI
ncbi:MAG: class I SAM-dependent methyltransferase [Chloroflexi bacterium]|nr:class I SAM-dependent methyltransferase [Chloroflexota bacterium]